MRFLQILPDTVKVVTTSANTGWIFYVVCFVIAFIGMALQTAMAMQNLQTKARLANIEFKPSNYFREDWLTIVISVLTIFMFMFLINDILTIKPEVKGYLKFAFAFIGYFSNDIASRLFSAANKRVNAAIDYKTTIADKATGTTDTPTPATK
jgi:hypothetical protein